MMSKKKAILNSALELFARNGYKGTSTSKIAKAAEVSEALIFRHFKNKEGLLHAVIEQGVEQSKLLLADVVLEAEPKKVLSKYIQLPFNFPENDLDYWKLIFKIKWEIEYSYEQNLEPVSRALENAFEKLGYENPKYETQFLLQFMDGLVGNILRGADKPRDSLREFLLKKYNLSE